MHPRPICFVLCLLLTLVFFIGCDEDSTSDPQSIPGDVLIAQAQVVNLQLQANLNPLRSKLNNFWGGNSPSEEIADSLLEKIVTTNTLIWSAGIINREGLVTKVFPVTEDSLLNRSWIDIPEVATALETPSLLTGTVTRNNLGKRTFNYYRSIQNGEHDFGVVYCALDADSIISMSYGLAEIDEENQRGLFILDASSRIIFDLSEAYFGQQLNDPLVFNNNTVSLANDIVDPSSDSGYQTYEGDEIPGGLIEGKQHLVAWSICPMEGNTFWSVVVIEPI